MSDPDDDAAGADGGKSGDGGAEQYSRGERLAADGALGEAEQAYRRADDAGHPAAAAKLGLLLEFRGKPKAAREAYARADERGDRLGAFRLGLLFAGDDRWDDARAAWARADEREHDATGFDLEAALHASHGSPGRTPSGDQRSALANPVLVGAMTVLVAMVAVFLAYNSNAGLPFVPTRELKLDIASGSDLVAGQRGPRGRLPDRAGVGHEADRVAERSDRRAADAQAEHVAGEGPGRFDGGDPSSVGARV